MTPDPITTARRSALELRQIACLLNDDQVQVGANFDREAAITAALDYADSLTRDVRDLQDLAKIRNNQHDAVVADLSGQIEKLQSALSVTQEEGRTEIARLEAEVEKLKAEADPEALVISHMHGAQMATEKHREEIEKLKAERDALEKSVSAHWTEIEHLNASTDSEITRLTSRLEQAERVIAPFARQAKSYEPDEGDGNHLAWDLGNVVTIGELRSASQWIKDLQAKVDPMFHEWHERFGLTCCKVCGFVRNENSDTKGCRGPVYVSLRDVSPVQPDSALTEALTRIEELEGALRPFIKAAGCLHDDEPDDMPIFLRWETNIKAGDLRRAATLTQGIKE